jgi:6-pyruvoyltetrahydropterin/6-carboxytetrahydropterin synthase
MFTIRKEFHFSASHQLVGLASDHPCTRLHGHNYVITVELEASKLNKVGFVTDYRDLQPMKDYIDSVLDHHHLNDIFPFNPTAELIAKALYTQFKKAFPQISAVECKETDKTSARYTPFCDESE